MNTQNHQPLKITFGSNGIIITKGQSTGVYTESETPIAHLTAYFLDAAAETPFNPKVVIPESKPFTTVVRQMPVDAIKPPAAVEVTPVAPTPEVPPVIPVETTPIA
jgi:hypothetical protein